VGHARAAGTPTGMRLSSAECEMSAAVDIFGHVTCWRFLYEATTAEVGCLVYARALTGPVGYARAAGAVIGARLASADCQISAAVCVLGHAMGRVFSTRPPRPMKSVFFWRQDITVLWDMLVRPAHRPERACSVRHVRCRL